MKIALFEDVRKVKLVNHKDLVPDVDEILIKIDACAICTWEQRVYTGVKEVSFPFVGGHEISATIKALGSKIDTKNWAVGDQVVYGTNLACGNCYLCKTGNSQNCQHFNHSRSIPGTEYIGMGGFSEYLLVKPEHLFKIKDVDPLEASLTEPVSCVVHSVESADVEFGDYVMVFGCGIMGQIHVQLAAKKGGVVIAVDMKQDRLNLAKEMGASYIINNSSEDLAEALERITGERKVQVIFNTTPIAKIAEDLVQYLAIKGRYVLYSSFYPDLPISISADSLHKKAQKLIGTANSNPRDFMRAAQMIQEDVINVKPFINKVYAFEDIEEAMNTAIKGEAYRIVLKMD